MHGLDLLSEPVIDMGPFLVKETGYCRGHCLWLALQMEESMSQRKQVAAGIREWPSLTVAMMGTSDLLSRGSEFGQQRE